MGATLRVYVLAGLFALLLAPAAVAFDITFDSGSGAITIINDGPGDLNLVDPGVIDFDITGAPAGGVFAASGRVFEFSGLIGFSAHLGGPPGGQGVLQNVGGASAVFTVEINSSPASAGPPLGWSLFYVADIDDPTLGPVNVPAHSVDLAINQTTTLVPLTSIAALPVAAPTSISYVSHGSDPTLSAAESRLTYSVDLDPNDRVLLPDIAVATGIFGSVFFQDKRCIDRMNARSGKLAQTAARGDTKCVKTAFAGGGGDATPCVDDPTELKTNASETKLLSDYGIFCNPTPAWGVNGATCCEEGSNDGGICSVPADCPAGSCVPGACISYAAEIAANDMTHELFGAGVIIGAGSGKCQTNISKHTGKVLAEHWKVFRTCKKANISVITDDVSLVATCLGPPQPDPQTRIAKSVAKVASAVGRCVTTGFSPVGALFGGACTAVADPVFHDCVAERARCAFCRSVNQADDIVPPLDCDLFDDAAANGSCP